MTAEYVRELDEKGEIQRNFDRPALKDTVIVPDGGYTAMRFIANNPGVWFVHCHLEYHMETGMAFLIKVGNPDKFSKVPNGWQKCGNFELGKDDTISNNSNKLFKFYLTFYLFIIIFSINLF